MTLPMDKFREELHKKLHPEIVKEVDVANETYENVVFLQGEEAVPYLKMIDELGAEAVANKLASDYYYPGDHEIVNSDPSGSGDRTFETEDNKFKLSWNSGIGYVGLIAKADMNESCGAGTASVPGSCGADTGIARFKAPIGGVERRIEETDEHEGNEEGEGAEDGMQSDDVKLPGWLDMEAVESAAHFMFRGFDENTIKKFVEDAVADCDGTEEALYRLKEFSKNDKVVSAKSFNEEELDALAEYRHGLRSKLFGGAKNAILDPDDYLNAKKTNEGELSSPSIMGAPSKIIPTQGQMSVDGSNNEVKRANLDIEIAKKKAELAAEVEPDKRKKIYSDLSRLEGQKSSLKESTMVYFPNVYAWNQGKLPLSKPMPTEDEALANAAAALGVKKEDIHVMRTLDSSDPIHVKLPGFTNAIKAGTIFTGRDTTRVSFDSNQAVEAALKTNSAVGGMEEGEHVINFSRSGDAVSYSLEEAIEMLANRLGVDENVFEITPVDQDKTSIFLNTETGKKKIADIVASHGGKFITHLDSMDNPELEDMLATTKSKLNPTSDVDEGVMTEKDDIDKKTIVGVLLTAGPEKVSKAFATAANQGQEQFYQLVNGIDVDGLKILSKGVQGSAQQNVDNGVQSPTTDSPAPDSFNGGGVEPEDSTNPAAGGSDLKDL